MTAPDWLLPVLLSLSFLLLSLLFGLTFYCLRKRSRDRSRYQELISTTPPVPACTAPLVLVSQGAVTIPDEIPFEIPPRFLSHKPEDLQPKEEPGRPGPAVNQKKETQNHRGSLCVSSWYPVGSLRSSLYSSSPSLPPSSPLSSSPLSSSPPSLAPLLCFSVEYRHHSEQLVVSLLRLSNLPLCFHSNSTLIELRLLPDDRRPQQAKARNTGPHPEFNHCTVFQVSPQTVSWSVLSLVVQSVGADSRHRRVGQVEVPLRGDLCHTGRVLWRALQTQQHQQQGPPLGEVLVSLGYSPHRLTVGVARVRGLHRDSSKNSGFVVQVSVQVQSQVRSKLGPVLESEDDLSLNLKHSFKLKQSQLEQSCVRVQVLHKDKATDSCVPVGAMVLGPFMFSRGPQLSHWMDCLSAPAGGAVERWHPLGPPV
ncbi:synaptotagmin-15 [Periophthalmus magnuspinnatus]|uniref:synaptotagmin-15 n=1 Tax=Periophthalmus magnuspinnatus TaxID=409849 RepID=UPI002436EAC7|nr:synaptotagmin-15 [Periophthalmus magnuspinnatus]